MFVRPNMGSDWVKGTRRFLAFMIREKNWRRNWIVYGGRFLCVGVIESYAFEDNDNDDRR